MTKQLPTGKIKFYFICGNGGDSVCVAGVGMWKRGSGRKQTMMTREKGL